MPELSRLEKELLREHFPQEEDRRRALERLDAGEPFAYVIGEWYFYGETYRLNEETLIPRPDTELLVEATIEKLPAGGVFCDLCTGSGCVAISVLAHRRDARAVAVELSLRALEAARENAVLNGVSDRIELICADVLTGNALGDRQFDLIVSNPPYIRTDVIPTLSAQVRREPRQALDGGEDGLKFYRAILKEYRKNLGGNGWFLFEIGYDQAEDLRALAPGCEIRRDYGGNDRVALCGSRTE